MNRQRRTRRTFPGPTRALMLLVGVVVLTGVGLVPAAASGGSVLAPKKADLNTVARYVVTAPTQHDLTTAGSRPARALGGKVTRTYSHAVFGFSADLTGREAALLARSAGVASVEPNRTFHTTTAPTVESPATWGLDRIDQAALPLDNSYSYTQAGSGVTAYVVDTGIFAGHPDFTGRVNPGYSAVDGKTAQADCFGHGTHVSGTIGGTTYGVAKVGVDHAGARARIPAPTRRSTRSSRVSTGWSPITRAVTRPYST